MLPRPDGIKKGLGWISIRERCNMIADPVRVEDTAENMAWGDNFIEIRTDPRWSGHKLVSGPGK